ncbi:hypothetical protein G6L28_03490 [Agrobacterium larrymoorei]|uniref:hypothetical protein n=1 Tax=Agrobacterium larrymoorei TaxID=160699 RepID=UPI001571FA6A|nr:hypothetical protein [Agrobacterium larrymoorei]NTJ41663.1 hypothetical protein [Agrobacterium larrymoorei]
MADIISFQAALRRFHKVADAVNPPAGPAQLLFFTGVRYERREVEAAKKSRKRKTAISGADAAAHS